MLTRLFMLIMFLSLFGIQVFAQLSEERQQYPNTFGHTALAVADIDKAIKWYQDVMGFKLIKGPIEVNVDGSILGEIACHLFGKDTKKLRIAQMTIADRTGIELFEFTTPKPEKPKNDEYRKTCLLHICIIVQNIEALVKKIEENGGKMRGKIWSTRPNQKVAFCEDPDGNIIEISTHSWVKQTAKISDPTQDK